MDSTCTYQLNYIEKSDGNPKTKTCKRECRRSIYYVVLRNYDFNGF